MNNDAPLTVPELSYALSQGHFSAVELVTETFRKISKFDSSLNSFITICEEEAFQQARHADKKRSSGSAHPLAGIPYGCKDIFCSKGVRTTCGSKMLEEFIAPYDSHVVDLLNKAGLVMVGKTNMDEFAMGSSNESSYFGKVANPWNTTRVPGGSSGGSAAAIAAGLIPIATGTDTGGSIRQPAAFCGITGLKPTYGRVSRYGMIAFASSLDQGGPMGRTAADIAALLNIMVDFDPRDSTCVQKPAEDFTNNFTDSLEGLRIGLPKEYTDGDLDSEIYSCMEKALEVYSKLGAKIVECSLQTTRLAAPAYYIIAPAECSSNLARYDGVRYGYRCESPSDLSDMYERTRGEGFGSEVKRRILVGTYALSSGYYDDYYLKAQKVRRLIQKDFVDVFKDVDCIAGPTTPTPAFEFDTSTNDPVKMYLSDIYTIAANLAGLPAISLPIGFSNGLPVGMQLIGNYFSESKILGVAHKYQLETDWHVQTPSVGTIKGD